MTYDGVLVKANRYGKMAHKSVQHSNASVSALEKIQNIYVLTFSYGRHDSRMKTEVAELRPILFCGLPCLNYLD